MDANVNAVIDNLCNKFGVAVEYLLPRIERYLVWTRVANVVICLLVLIVCAIAFRIASKLDEETCDEARWCLGFVSVCGLLISWGLFLFHLHSVICVIASPEVAGLKYIVELIK